MRTIKKITIGLAVLAVNVMDAAAQFSELWESTREYAESMFVIVWYFDPPHGVVRPLHRFLPLHWDANTWQTTGSLRPKESTVLDSERKLATEYGQEHNGYKTNKEIGNSKEESLVFYIHPGRQNNLSLNNLLKVELFPGRGHAIITHREFRRIVPVQKYTRTPHQGYKKDARTAINLGNLK